MIRHLVSTLVIGCILFDATGCTRHRIRNESPAAWQNSGFHPTIPSQPFCGYEEAFKYIAACEGLPTDHQTLFSLAADSTLERSWFLKTGEFLIVKAEYYGQWKYGIRGAQGQGRYYVFQILGNKLRLAGILHGNTCRWSESEGTLQIITRWHVSASESPETVYTWNGQLFE
jgi:hypothetical protein